MPITTIQPTAINQRPTAAPRQSPDLGFSALLDSQDRMPATAKTLQEVMPDRDAAPLPTAGPEPDGLIPLGEISQATPSVSHLLLNHPSFRQQCWDIVFAKVNQGKPFTTMRPGMTVSLNQTTRELVWSELQAGPAPVSADEVSSPEPSTKDGRIMLGTINPETPTVSTLLTRTSRYRDQAWEIISSEANRQKPYAALQSGCQVSLDPQTLDLSFKRDDGSEIGPPPIVAEDNANRAAASAEFTDEHRSFAKRLAESVKSYLGQPYHKIDCYSLVVRGLKSQGVQYSGQGGLLEHLERLATREGLPANAYQNGEGLIEAAGNKLYDESFTHIRNAGRQSREVLDQLQPLLHEGMLLSFSTPTRGHTGVIAKKDGQWTYVNSGMIDHQVNGGKVSRRVGEETLADEIRNWFLLAGKDGTSLKVSAGMFDTEKLKAASGVVATNRPKRQELI